ncbi:MAG: efflux RND transporter permease subunit [Phycisphaeraceae bacterium]|nr:efflux RND transporter permease subunit [Phycisphaeraceae bacterium]
MKISEQSVEHPRIVLVVALALTLFGLLGVRTLPKERTPRIKLPIVMVAVSNPGAQPLTNDTQIVRKIEEEAAGELSDLDEDGGLQSQALYGAGLVQFFFQDGVDIRDAKQDVQELVNRIKGEFPARAQTDPGPVLQEIDFEGWPVVQVFLAGGEPGERYTLADELKDRIEELEGVRVVQEFGRRQREVSVLLAPERLAEQRLTSADVIAALERGNIDLPTGELERAGIERRVRFDGRFADLDEVRGLPVEERDGSIVRLGDVAEVAFGYEPQTSIARYGGRDAVVLQAMGMKDINVLALADKIEALVGAFAQQRGMSAGLDGAGGLLIGTNRSQGREIRIMFDQLGSSAVFGMALVVLVLTVFMGWRNALLISIAIPFSLVVAAALMLLAKRTFFEDLAINNMSLFSLILVIGMVVDGALIVGENIYRHREMGQSPVDAAKLGIREVGPAVLSADLTTIAAFAPMYVVRGVMGDFMGTMPTVVIFALGASLLVDHFLLPALSVYVMKPAKKKLRKAVDGGHSSATGEIDPVAISKMAEATALSRLYGRVIRRSMEHRRLVIALTALTLATPAVLAITGALGFEFFPESDIAQIEAYVETPMGTDMETGAVVAASRVEEAMLRAIRPEEWHHPVKGGAPVQPTTTIGETSALSTRLEASWESGPEFARIFCELTLEQDRDRSVNEIIDAIRAELPDMPGVRVELRAPTEGPPTGSDIYVRVLGDDSISIERLAERADEVESIVASIPGTTDVSSSHRLRPQYRATPIREVAGFFGVTTVDIARALSSALRGVEVTDVDFGGDEEFDIRVRSTADTRRTLSDLKDLPVRTASGRVVSLDQVADVRRVVEPNQIKRYDRKRMIAVSASLDEGTLADDVKRELVARLGASSGDAGGGQGAQSEIYRDREVVVQFGGENEFRDEAVEDLELAMQLAIALMGLILIVQFNSFVQPLIVLAAVPMSLIGVSFGLALIGLNFSVAAMIGVVALAGIVVNDGIVLVSFINQLRAVGVEKERACVLAGQLRLRPVFLTTVTTIGGLAPLALNLSGGGEFWQPLTYSIIFGYSFATALTLVVIPLLYTMLIRESGGFLTPGTHPVYSRPPAELA